MIIKVLKVANSNSFLRKNKYLKNWAHALIKLIIWQNQLQEEKLL